MIFDRFLESLRALVGAETSRLDYLGLYRCKVVSQNADGTLELLPDDARLPPLSGVQVYGPAGIAMSDIPAGSHCLVGFSNGDPSQRFAALFELTTATLTFNGGTKAVGRVDDAVQVTIQITDVATMALTSPSGPVTATSPVTVSGKITAGAANLKA